MSTERSYILKQTCCFQQQICLSMYVLLVDTSCVKGLNVKCCYAHCYCLFLLHEEKTQPSLIKKNTKVFPRPTVLGAIFRQSVSENYPCIFSKIKYHYPGMKKTLQTGIRIILIKYCRCLISYYLESQAVLAATFLIWLFHYLNIDFLLYKTNKYSLVPGVSNNFTVHQFYYSIYVFRHLTDWNLFQ